jgi:thioredoxin-like negative regulator of GroEL
MERDNDHEPARPRRQWFTLGSFMLLVVAVLLALGGFQTWRMLYAPLTWDEYSDERLESELKRGRSVVVHFWAPWCNPSLVYQERVLESNEFCRFAHREDLVTLELNVENDPAVARRLRVRSLPSIAIYSAGNPVPADVIQDTLSIRELIQAVTLAKEHQIEQHIDAARAQPGNGQRELPKSSTAAID